MSYDIIVRTLPTVPEVPQVVLVQHEAMRSESPTATPHNSLRPA